MKIFVLGTFFSFLLSITSIAIADSSHPMKFNFELKTLNPNIDDLNDINYGYQFEFEYSFNRNIYAKASSTIYNHGRVGYGGRLGYTFNYNKFSPYTEMGIDTRPGKKGNTAFFAYDLGTSYHLTSRISPFLELDNAALPKRTAIKIGSTFRVTNSFSLKADYIQDISHSGNGAELELSYNF